MNFCVSLLLSLFSNHSTSLVMNIDTMQMNKEILAEFAKQPSGEFAVAFKDISTGQEFLINAHERFHAASTMKTPIMIETFKQAAEGKFRLTDSMLIHNDFKSIVDGSTYSLDSTEDSEKDIYGLIGKKMAIKDILFKMITKSSNLSTNLMVDFVGAKNANKTMRSLGAKDIQVLRGVEDGKAYDLGLNNTVTAYDLMLIFEHLANGNVVSKKACDEMIEILEAQYFRDIIPAKLPAGIRTATKTGSITKICHDSGIVFLPGGKKYVVVLLSKGIEDQRRATEVLASVSKIIYNHVVGDR
ncbi:MAG: serine hydrolase [Ginsengibacter sp.]